MASKRVLRAWAGCAAFALAGLLAVGGAGTGNAAPPVCSDAAYLTWREVDGGRHTLSIIDFDSKRRTDVATLDYHVNAIGYATADERLYGLARARGGVLFDQAPHLVSIDADGTVRDWGTVRAGDFDTGGLAGSYAGTVYDDELWVLSGTRLSAIDIAADRGRITRQTILDEPLVSLGIGDITAVPGEKLLYGLSTQDRAVVAIDPGSGAITRTPVTGLPARSLAGAIFTGPDRRLHAVVNGVDGDAVMYRVAVPGKDSESVAAVAEARWPRLTSADAAFCAAPKIEPRPKPDPTPGTSPAPSRAAGAASPGASPSPNASPRAGARPSDADSAAAAARPHRPRSEPEAGRPPGSRFAATESESEPPKRWIAVGVVLIGIVGAAGVKASASRKSK